MVLGHRRATIFNTLFNLILYIMLSFIFKAKINFFIIIFSFITLVLYYIFNIYNLEKGKYETNDVLISFFLNLILLLFAYIDKNILLMKIIFSMFIFQNILKYFLYKLMINDKNVLIIGKNKDAEVIKRILNEKNIYNIVAELSYLEIDDLKKIISGKKIDKIIITENLIKETMIKKVLNAKLNGIKIFNFVSFFEKIEEKVLVNRIDEKWLLYENGFNILHDDFQKRIKRVFDFLLAIIIGIITLPLMILSAAIVKLESPGPILFKQKRIGLSNEEFVILKFRSMRNDAEKDGAKWAVKNDPRVTKFGKVMRKTRIDELPQLINVLKGEMTFVGPRPERQIFIETLEKEIPFYNIRHAVKPGLTGWAQVKYPYGASVKDALRKLEYDLYYIKHQSFIFDMMIIFKTAKTVVFGKGR